MYMEFDPTLETAIDVTGHEKDLEILSWNHGFSQPTSPVRSSAGSGTVEQANHQNFSFTRYLDGATPLLLKKCWGGKQFNKATLHCYRATDDSSLGVKYLTIEMQHVVVSNYSVSGGPGDIPVENISLDYGIVTYNYDAQKRVDGTASGAKPATHNLETRKIE